MNHVIIGLGGTGGKVIRSLRKLIYTEFRKEAPDGVDVGFLYVDSSKEMMAFDDPTWKVLGTSVQLPVASQLTITGEDLSARLANIQTYPGIKPWIGDRAVWGEILGSIVGAALGGQKRRLGRFLLACKIDDLKKQIQSIVRSLQANGQTDITFHVVAGLAGGTGSGSIIDVVAQLRAMYGQPGRHKIVPYLLLPDQFPPPNWDTGNYHANGFAALSELNALSTGAYQPIDVSNGSRLDLKDAFNGAYVFGNENETGYQADVDREIPGIVAEFLFQKIVVAAKVGWRSLERMENAENGDGTPETTPGGRVGERSKRFLSFGIKRLAIPEEEIKEYLSLNFARQAIQQLRYNNWQDTLGFVDEARNVDVASFVRQPDVLGRWQLADESLTLSVPILATDDPAKRWKPLTGEWESVLPTFKSMAREQPAPTWIDELGKYFQKRFEESFRNAGVASFYRTKAMARKDMAREVRARVERELFDDWRNGARSAAEVARVLAALLSSLNERMLGVDDTIFKLNAEVEDARAQLAVNAKKWADLGLFGKLVGGRDNIFDAEGIFLQELYVRLTRIEAWTFAKPLLAEISTEISDLKANVDAIVSTMQDALRRVSTGIDERLKKADVDDLKGHLIRFYDPDTVRRVTRALSTDEGEQRTQTAKVRADLVASLGPSPTFTSFATRLGLGELIDRIESATEENAQIAHNTLVTESRDRILGVSIVAKLKERYGGDQQALRGYVAKLVKEAGCFITLNPLERNRAGPGIASGVQTLIEKWIVILPKAPEQAAFVEQLKQAFRDAQPGDLEFIEADDRANQITMISVKNLFPLRYLGILPFLQERYQTRIAANPVRFALELHTEGTIDSYPALFVKSGDELRREALAYLLLGRSTGAVVELNGALVLQSKDADGFDNPPRPLGASLLVAPDAIDYDLLADLKRTVDGSIGAVKDKAALEDGVRSAAEGVKPLVGGDVGDPRYRAVVDAARGALKIIRGQ
ncbi:tubulin-like doman-containing protein [Polymorphobacter megasporae]|uniref:tubulin-like doman-containing protein n=1 Tax=Glacieibacterium megasporae TaxID=2835787 RepID=UPI001C1E2298|nr:tubulin-like doman-containing protein [Polymorphobacter megasporae]UAJ08883.1 tubulin-like doman-containing protein [Polymorphobacter megasporae]